MRRLRGFTGGGGLTGKDTGVSGASAVLGSGRERRFFWNGGDAGSAVISALMKTYAIESDLQLGATSNCSMLANVSELL